MSYVVDKIRKEVHLFEADVEQLQEWADKEGRSIKNYMERVLENHLRKRRITSANKPEVGGKKK